MTAVNDGFRTAFLIAAGLALLAAALLAIAIPVAAGERLVGYVALGSVAGVLVFGLLAQSVRPEPVAIADPCAGPPAAEQRRHSGISAGRRAESRRHRGVPRRLLA